MRCPYAYLTSYSYCTYRFREQGKFPNSNGDGYTTISSDSIFEKHLLYNKT
ncbi:hypothetical protein GLO73106DRAFT_00002080 [Gloeocapsa sp. PCC 73106]|nr:hypothetical protein GLO73106DRAFT_00002080 [Gloeocapsa sp. PCC 73106]